MKRRDKITWDSLIVLTRVTEGHDRIGKKATFKIIEAENIAKLFKKYQSSNPPISVNTNQEKLKGILN